MAANAHTRQRILVGASIRQQQHVFDAYWRALNALHPPTNCTLEYCFVNDDDALLWPDGCAVLPAPERPATATYSIDDTTHHWSVDTFEHLARCKQLLLDYAVAERYDYIFLCDSDLLCEPSTLRSLYATGTDVVSAVFWTQWQPNAPPLPQCWLQHPYGLAGLGMRHHEYINALLQRQLVRVLGGGACTLVRTSVLDRLHYHPRLPLPTEGMWQGEDRTFAVLAQQHHIVQYADAWPRVFHAYSPQLREPEMLTREWGALNAPQQCYAGLNDLVNLRLTPAEDHQLEAALSADVRCVRGRLAALNLAPELLNALTDMQVGDRRMVDVSFGEGDSVYSPCSKAILMELVDARPYTV